MPDDALTSRPSAPTLDTLVDRRRMLSLMGIGGLGLVAAACSSSGSGSGTAAGTATEATATTAATTTAAPATSAAASSTVSAATETTAVDTTAVAAEDLTVTPSETGGPFPADGSNDNGDGEVADILADARSLRADIRADLDGSNVQEGVPMTLTTTVLDDATGRPLAGAALYVWHCNKAGEYSAYNSSMLGGDFSDRTFLRGAQITDDSGTATFTTVLPGRYRGRAFHIHFSVYADGTYAEKLLTSQMAMADDEIEALYTAAGYDDALSNDTSNDSDNIFADGVDHQLLTVSGDVSNGLTASINVVV